MVRVRLSSEYRGFQLHHRVSSIKVFRGFGIGMPYQLLFLRSMADSVLHQDTRNFSCYTREIEKNSKQGENGMRELGSTYVVQDRDNQEELKRLIVQDHLITTTMGGVLPEQPDPGRFRRVLDIGCGPGGWILEAAQAYPQMKKLYGIDISTTIINHAREQAAQQNVATGPQERVEFLVMDALRMLEFPDDFFDLANLRFGSSFMRQWDWLKMFDEMHRVTRLNGIIRIVDGQMGMLSESAALNRWFDLMRRALYRAGHLFEESPKGLVDSLPSLLVKFGFTKLEVRKQVDEYRFGTAAGDALIEDLMLLFHTLRPYLRRYGCEPKDYDAICLRAAKDMQTSGFTMTWELTTFWVVNPHEINGLNYDPGRLGE
jgi:ubiquinone/menaquinone biosynthesis C-methylase UbiE